MKSIGFEFSLKKRVSIEQQSVWTFVVISQTERIEPQNRSLLMSSRLACYMDQQTVVIVAPNNDLYTADLKKTIVTISKSPNRHSV